MDTLLPVRTRPDSRAIDRMTGLLRLPTETYVRARGRLGLLAGVVACVFLSALVLNEVFPIYDTIPRFSAVNRLSNATGLLSSVVVLSMCRWRAISAQTALMVGTLWEWTLCLHTGSLVVWVTANAYGHAPELTWAIPVMLIFPLIIPMPTGVVLVVSAVAATMPLVGTLIMQTWGWIPQLQPHDWHNMVLNHYVVLPLPVLVSHVIYGLTVEAHQARMLGRYQLEERIGRGGMGEVWRVTHRLLTRPAAAKLVRGDLISAMPASTRARAVERFTREARVTAGLTSPHTVQLYDFGFTEDGSAYYVMELLDGVDLETLVATWGPLPPERVGHVMWQVCESLAEAHGKGLVHRDIKPANLFLCRKGNRVDHVAVLDFGLVALRRELADDDQLTLDGTLGGTPAYMAPELATGGAVDGRADLYALGCVAYFLLTGEPVFPATTVFGALLRHANDVPDRPSVRAETDAPAVLDELVMRLLAKRPDDRPQSAGEVQQILQACGLMSWSGLHAQQWWDMHLPAPAMAAHV